MRGPFQFREFRLLFAARVISLTGSAIAPIALAFGVLQATGEATDLGIGVGDVRRMRSPVVSSARSAS